MHKIYVMVGTTHGNAEHTAFACIDYLQAQGLETLLVYDVDDIDVHRLSENDACLFVSSTTGEGDLPDTIVPMCHLFEQSMPDLSSVPYGVIALGDSSYQYFCQAGNKIDILMKSLHAIELLPLVKIDACEIMKPEELAIEWCASWCQELRKL